MTAPPILRWSRHDGSPGLDDADYLVAPDPAIGPVVSAETNRRRGGWMADDRALRSTILTFAVFGAALAAAPAVYAYVARARAPWTPADICRIAIPALAGAVVGAVVTWLVRPRRSTYVGRLGVQLYAKRPGLPGRTRTLVFARCAKLRVLGTRQFLNGAYTRTTYHYAWFDHRDARVFVLAGSYDDRRLPTASEPVVFARAAQAAWKRRPPT